MARKPSSSGEVAGDRVRQGGAAMLLREVSIARPIGLRANGQAS
jgi:hypothetical protein